MKTEGARFDFGYPCHSPSHSLFETIKIGSVSIEMGTREFYLGYILLSNWQNSLATQSQIFHLHHCVITEATAQLFSALTSPQWLNAYIRTERDLMAPRVWLTVHTLQSSHLGSRAVIAPKMWGALVKLQGRLHSSENTFHFLIYKIYTLKQKAYISFS